MHFYYKMKIWILNYLALCCLLIKFCVLTSGQDWPYLNLYREVCRQNGAKCDESNQCCSKVCYLEKKRCTDCTPVGAICGNHHECCSGACALYKSHCVDRCYTEIDRCCCANYECCSGNCDRYGFCKDCLKENDKCSENIQCCGAMWCNKGDCRY